MKKADSKASEKTSRVMRPPGAKEPQGGVHNPLLRLQQGLGNRLLSEVLDGKVQCDFWDDIWGGGGNGYNETGGEVGYNQTSGSAGWNPAGGEAGYNETSDDVLLPGQEGQVPATAGFNYGYEPYEVGGGGAGGEIGGGLAGDLGGLWDKGTDKLKKGAANKWDSAKEWGDLIFDPEKSAGEKLEEGADKAWGNVKGKAARAGEGAEKAWDYGTKGAEQLWDWGTEGAEQLWDTSKDVASGVGEAAGSAWETGKEAAGEAWDTTKDVASGVGEAAGSVWDWATGGGGGGGGEDWWQMKPEGEAAGLQPQGDGANVGSQVMGMIDARRGGGQALDEGIRAQAESALDFDFKDVRLHTGSEADELAAGLKARAFTTGKDVFFRAKDYDPHSPSGQELIGHELTHVLQQHQGLSEPAGRPGDRYEREADRVGAEMFKGGAVPAAGGGAGGGSQLKPEEGALQGQEMPEEEVQAQADEPWLLAEQLLAGEKDRDYGPKYPEGPIPRRPYSPIPGVGRHRWMPGVSDQPEVEKLAPGKEEELQSQAEEEEEVQAKPEAALQRQPAQTRED